MLSSCGQACMLISEENEEPIIVSHHKVIQLHAQLCLESSSNLYLTVAVVTARSPAVGLLGCVRVGLIHFWVSHQLFGEAFAFAHLKLNDSSNVICLFWLLGWMSLEFVWRGALIVETWRRSDPKFSFLHQRGARKIIKTSWKTFAWVTCCSVHFLASPELLLFFTASHNWRRGYYVFQMELDKVPCSEANIQPKVKGTVGKVVTLQDSSEDEGDQVKTIPEKRKASRAESTGPNEKKQKLESTGKLGKQKLESTGRKGKMTETRSRRSDQEALQKEFAESRERSRRGREARERHDSKMEKLDRMNNILEHLVDKLLICSVY